MVEATAVANRPAPAANWGPAAPRWAMAVIDLNADLGESFGNWSMGDDAAMLDVVTSANIACGFHAGDPSAIRRTVQAAVERDVVIGAHVGYPDLVGFGRRRMDVEPDDLLADVLYQLGALDGMCRVAGTRLRYVKAHGALYHRVNSDLVQARAFANAVALYDATLPILGADGPLLAEAVSNGLRVVGEGFADRSYRDDGTLVPRSEPGAVHSDPQAVAVQAVALARREEIGSVCLHGDSTNAVSNACEVHTRLLREGFTVQSFVNPSTRRSSK